MYYLFQQFLSKKKITSYTFMQWENPLPDMCPFPHPVSLLSWKKNHHYEFVISVHLYTNIIYNIILYVFKIMFY